MSDSLTAQLIPSINNHSLMINNDNNNDVDIHDIDHHDDNNNYDANNDMLRNKTNELTIDTFLEHEFLVTFFLFSTLLLPRTNLSNCCFQFTYFIYFIMCFFGLLSSLAFSVLFTYYRGPSVDGAGYPSHLLLVFYACASTAVLMEWIVLVIGVRSGRVQLSKHIRSRELIHYPETSKQCLAFYLGFFLLFGCGVGLYPYNFDEAFVFAASAIGGTVGIVINMFFLTCTCRAVCLDIQDLQDKVSTRQLTMDMIKKTRDNVKMLSDVGFMVNSLMALSAIIHGIVFVVGILSLQDDHSLTTEFERFGRIIVYIAIFLKEIVYLTIILFEIAAVNDRADKLLLELSDASWKQYSLELESERHAMCITLANRPISFRLFFSRPTKFSVFLQILTYITSLVVSTSIKSATG